MSVPQLRFKEFDGDWIESKLKDCIDSIDSGWSPQCESHPADENEWAVLKTTSVDWDGFKANFNKKLPSNLEARFEIEVKPNDILVTRAGPTERVGVVAVVPHNVRSRLMISDKLIRLKANNENNPEFLGISLSSVKCQNQLQSKTSGLAKSQTNISQKILSDVSLITPSKLEQTKIASFLSAVDEKISQLNQKHELLSQYKQGMMQKLFSQQIRFKADDGSEFGEWSAGSLANLTDIQGGYAFKSTQFGNGDTKVLRIGDILKNIDLDNFDGVTSSEVPDKRYYVSQGAIVMALSGATFGKLGKVQSGTACINQRVATFTVKESSTNEFLYQIMLSKDFYTYIQSIPSASAQPNISNQDVMSFELDIPCLEEQTKIANFLSSIDQKIDVSAQQIEQAKQWKKGLLQQMFV